MNLFASSSLLFLSTNVCIALDPLLIILFSPSLLIAFASKLFSFTEVLFFAEHGGRGGLDDITDGFNGVTAELSKEIMQVLEEVDGGSSSGDLLEHTIISLETTVDIWQISCSVFSGAATAKAGASKDM
jgi:hypothetical protein